MPAVLKNARDVGPRPYGQSVWNGKPGAVVTASSGQLGGLGANHHLRQSLVFLNVPTLQQPEAYLGGVTTILNQRGEIEDTATRDFLNDFMEAFALSKQSWTRPSAAARSQSNARG